MKKPARIPTPSAGSLRLQSDFAAHNGNKRPRKPSHVWERQSPQPFPQRWPRLPQAKRRKSRPLEWSLSSQNSLKVKFLKQAAKSTESIRNPFSSRRQPQQQLQRRAQMPDTVASAEVVVAAAAGTKVRALALLPRLRLRTLCLFRHPRLIAPPSHARSRLLGISQTKNLRSLVCRNRNRSAALSPLYLVQRFRYVPALATRRSPRAWCSSNPNFAVCWPVPFTR